MTGALWTAARFGAGVPVRRKREDVRVNEHKHVAKIDKARKHKRPGWVYIVCDCGATGQGTLIQNHLHVARWNAKKYVRMIVLLPREQFERLSKLPGNRQDTVRAAIDKELSMIYTVLHKQ